MPTGQRIAPGYSGTPLPKKLGLKDGQRALFLALPETLTWLTDAAGFIDVRQADSADGAQSSTLDVAHAFFTEAGALADALPTLMRAIGPDGMLWVSWPKRASGVATDITEDVIRQLALPIGLVDIKVCAVDEIWSGLKLVIRKELRRR